MARSSPLRGVTAQEVAEAFVGIMCRTGLPDTILTDRGSVFTSSVFKKVCELFGCGKLTTTPYHPQGNGVVERLHGTLKPMLAKAGETGLDWVRFLPLALFALRQMPHSDSGLSPFDLVYGFQVRGPLDIVYVGWTDDVFKQVALTKWVETLKERVAQLTDLSVARRKQQKDRQRDKINQTRSTRVYNVDDRVYLKVPGRTGAFQASWEGPFTIKEALSKVNYRLVGNGLPREGRVVHIYNLKSCGTKPVFRAVVAEYLEHETKGEKTFLGEKECEGFDMGELRKVLDRQAHVFSETPGLYTGREVKLTVTEGVKPVNQPVRRVPFSLKEGVKEAVRKLVEQGIVERADDSLWCSPIVPVRKPDGSVRVCVDFRALNEATPQIRYHMPTLDEVLDQAGECKVLTTLDLTAGFHQLALT